MNNHEDVFAEEAQEEILHRDSQNNQQSKQSQVSAQNVDENSPLIDSQQIRPSGMTHRRGYSYQRAINEPWTGAYGAGDRPWYKTPSVYWLLPAFFPFCIAFGGIIVPKTYLIQDLICRDLLADRSLKDPSFTFAPITPGTGNPQCDDDNEVQKRTALFSMYANLLAGFFSAIVAPHFGALSDRIGRKPVIVFATFGGFVGELITIIVGRNPDTVSVNWILLGFVTDGLCGSFTTSMALCFAYASDCTPPETRGVAFGRFHACLFAGVALGPIFAAALIKATDSILGPFYFALGCHIFFILFTLFVVPESLSKERQIIARERRAAEAETTYSYSKMLKDANIFAPLSILRPKGPGTSSVLRRNLFALATIDTLMFGVAMGTMQLVLIYARKRFHWDPIAASGFLTAGNVCRVLALIVVLPLLTRWFRGPQSQQSSGHTGSDKLDIGLIRAVILFDLVGYMGYAFTPSGAIMILSGMVASFGGIGPPTLQSSLTKHVPADRTGQMLGASALLHAIARVVSPIVFNTIYSRTVASFPGFVFLCLGSIFVLVFLLSWFIKPGVYLDEGQAYDGTAEENEGLTANL